jgi:hypothetical protein
MPFMSQKVRVFHIMLFDVKVKGLGSVEKLAAKVASKLLVGKLNVTLEVGPRTKLFIAAFTTTVVSIVVEANRSRKAVGYRHAGRWHRGIGCRIGTAVGFSKVRVESALDIKLAGTRGADKLLSKSVALGNMSSELGVASKRRIATFIGTLDGGNVGAFVAVEMLVCIKPFSAVRTVQGLFNRM